MSSRDSKSGTPPPRLENEDTGDLADADVSLEPALANTGASSGERGSIPVETLPIQGYGSSGVSNNRKSACDGSISPGYKSGAEQAEDGPEIDPLDLECSLCVSVLVHPIRTPCGHLFCRPCISDAMNYNDTCPLCRQELAGFEPVFAAVELAIEKSIAHARPEELSERLAEVAQEQARRARLVRKRIIVGNRYRYLEPEERRIPMSRNAHKWRMFVDLAPNNLDGPDDCISRYIDHVVYELHPSFQRPRVTIRQAPFEMGRTGWGMFEVGVTIHWKEEFGKEPLELYHMLEFEEGGHSTAYNVTFDPENVLTNRTASLQIV